jgi:hypothetical protein
VSFIFATLLSKEFHILRQIQRDNVINTHMPLNKNTFYSFQTLMKLDHSQQIFEKCSDIKFDKNPPSGSRVVPSGRTDGKIDRQTNRET